MRRRVEKRGERGERGARRAERGEKQRERRVREKRATRDRYLISSIYRYLISLSILYLRRYLSVSSCLLSRGERER
ncbi:hypothetical protein DPMN_152050 [Dreissena polymorpha]|uniref:Uncharacterized protein n=1 Tax=Dreissena polymorpha TaxID=45954 RepID=A0A9D4FI92_DREPO|nr:hypothetical protein DPMN_152050 [Dreissena polymorpha]